MPLALTRSPGQAVLFTGALDMRLEVLRVYRYHVELAVDGRIEELRAGTDLHVTPELMLQLSDINGRQARIAFTAPDDVQIMREELVKGAAGWVPRLHTAPPVDISVRIPDEDLVAAGYKPGTVLRVQPTRHTVRRDATGDYTCSCGATWDYRDGAEHP